MKSFEKRSVIVWGAGRIGRGFIAEAFSAPGYRLALVDISKPLVEALNRARHYDIYHADAFGVRKSTISGYRAFEAGDMPGLEPYFLGHAPILCLTGFADKVDELARMLAHPIRVRAGMCSDDPIDFLLAINMMRPERAFREALCRALGDDPQALRYLETRVGIAPSVVMCITPATPDQYLALDPLSIYNNNFPEWIVGRDTLKGEKPDGLPMLRLSENIEAEETRKIYSLNMAHACASYLSAGLGMTYMREAIADPSLRAQLIQALEESAAGLSGAFGFSRAEMSSWNQRMVSLLENPHMSDDLIRLGSDTRRKLGAEDRLVGAARLCLKHGGEPVTIARAIRRGFAFENDDEGTRWVQRLVREKGFLSALRAVSHILPGERLYDLVVQSE